MSIEEIIYPGFNKSLSELNCIKKINNNLYEVLDFTDIEWVRSALSESAVALDKDVKFEFKEPSADQLDRILSQVGADKTPDQIKDAFND